MLRRLSHVGIAVNDLAQASALITRALALQPLDRQAAEQDGVEVVTFDVGGVRLELMQPTSADSPVARFLLKHGEGVHHLAFEVDDLASDLARAQSAGVEAVDKSPRPGLGGTSVAFLHPKGMLGILTELVGSSPR